MAAEISILVGNSASLVALGHTKIEIWLSTDEGRNYEEVTASSAQAAVLISSKASTTFRMGGKLLKLKVDGGAEESVLFSDLIQYWTPLQVANRINEVVDGLASVLDSRVILTSPTTGRLSILEVTYNDADDLGWITGLKVYGKAARISLDSDTLAYSFSDPVGKGAYRYKWRFTANGSEPISDFSSPVYGAEPSTVSAGSLSICTARFVGIDGRPVKRTVLVGHVNNPQSLNGLIVASEEVKAFTSGDDGYLQFSLVRGSKVRVAIEGTTLVREFTVPDEETFDLLEVMSEATDVFTVQSVPASLPRRSL